MPSLSSKDSSLDFPLQEYLQSRRIAVESALNRYIPDVNEPPEKLYESMRYSVLAPGKRLRPILAIAAAEAIGGSIDQVIPTACALECIHAFSLIHDDLPCMDNDNYRRGLPTNHRVFGDAMALLAGDALLTLAFQLIVENSCEIPAERLLPIVHLIARASGTRGMVGGQVADMEAEGKPVEKETLMFIHAHKTGALLSASVQAGAIIAGATEEQQNAISAYGEHVGLAFQIADDVLDVTGDENLIGKPVGSDQERGKATFPSLFGLDESRRIAQKEMEAALNCLNIFDNQSDPLRAIARFIVDRNL